MMRGVPVVLLLLAAVAQAEPRSVSRMDLCDARDFAACEAAAQRLEQGDADDQLGAFLMGAWLCSQRDRVGCEIRARHLGSGFGEKRLDPFIRIDWSCQRGNRDDCFASGLWLRELGGSVDGVMQRLEQACDQGDARGCAILGFILGEELQKKDPARARNLLKLACARARLSCGELAEKAADPAEGRRLTVEDCESGHPIGCTLLGVLLRDGVGGARDLPAARARLEQSCALGEPFACVGAGRMARDAVGGPADLEQARRRLVRGCRGGASVGCRDAATLQWDAGEHEAADDALDLGCWGGDASACALQAQCIAGGGCAGGRSKQLARLVKACDEGHAQACHRLGEERLVDGEGDESKRAFGAACKLGHAPGCRAIALEGTPEISR
jgi:TPR repeat protein